MAFNDTSRTHAMRKLLPFVFFGLAVGLTAFAQPPVAPDPRPVEKESKPTAPDEGPNPPGKKDGPSGGPTESPRMTKLKQLSFDRRPSTILKAWAPKPKDEKPT